MAPNQTYDFIVVGGGTAGCLLAYRLSHSPAKPSILLLEAGTNPSGAYIFAPAHRFATVLSRPDLNFGYESEPEPALNDRIIPYARGKGLGGSTITNFGAYLYGSSEDYNRWGEIVGDNAWAWDSVRESFHSFEKYETEGVEAYKHLADPSAAQHGTNGKLSVRLPPVLEEGVLPQFEAVLRNGEKVCLDPNSGDPVGMSVFPYSYSKKGRCTSAVAFLEDTPNNLEIWTDAMVTKLIFEDSRVVGVETADGRKALTTNEVILSSGAIDTPRLLLLHGIGPKDELESLGIEVRKHLPAVGKHLQDHSSIGFCVEVDGSMNDRTTFESNPTLVEEAQVLWDKDQTGALAIQQTSLWGGFLKIPGLENTPEFKGLSKSEQEFLTRPAVPHYEVVYNTRLAPPGTILSPGNTYVGFVGMLMNPKSEGSVTLRSKDSEDKPVIRLNYYTHPYDVLGMREIVRSAWKLLVENPELAPFVRKTIRGPPSLSDADVDAYCRQYTSPVWHANGTVRMGREEEDGCVDSTGKVYGVQGLRIADLSICPLTTNNHTQATAYLVGQKISEKVAEEYGWNK